VRFADPTGLWRSWERRWRPTVSAQLVFELPMRNNAAHGRLVQEESSWEMSRIQRRDLERNVRDNVAQVAESVRRSAETVARNREALGFYEKTLDAAMARFQAGDITLIDTLTTEEDLTRQRQALVRAMQDYLSQLARLKYETGELVAFADVDAPGGSVEFDATPFVGR
jgi:outer membrane protein TolC